MREPESESGLSRWVRGFFLAIGWSAAVALVVVLVLYAGIIIEFHHKPSGPDVAGIARSRPAVAADLAAASATSASLKSLAPSAASWLVPGPTAVSDFCASSEQSDAFTTSWTPTSCSRTVTAYFFFNGSFEQHMRAWGAALEASGWSADHGDPLSLPLSYYAQYGDRPGPGVSGRTYLATSLPSSGDYVRAGEGSSAAGPAVYLEFRWAERPQVTASVEGVYGVPVSGPNTVVAWMRKQTAGVSPDVVESAAFARYQYVAVATMTAPYYVLAASS